MGFGTSKQSSNSSSTGVQSSTSTSSSSNQAYPTISAQLSPTVTTGTDASNAIRALLGMDGGGAQDAGFQKYLDSSGYQFQRDQGVGSITGSQAAKGLLSSGSTLKGITAFGNNLASSYLDKYLSSLTGLQNAGLNAANTIVGAGQTSNSSSTSSGNTQSQGSGSGSSMNFSFK